jgi:MFS family permease
MCSKEYSISPSCRGLSDSWAGRQHSKSCVLLLVVGCLSSVVFIAVVAAIEEMERDLPATSSEISLSISLFILVQGIAPLFWSALSEVKGRRVSSFQASVFLAESSHCL